MLSAIVMNYDESLYCIIAFNSGQVSNTEELNGVEESSSHGLSDQTQLLRLSECIKQLSDTYVEVCSSQDVGFKILQTAMQSEVVLL